MNRRARTYGLPYYTKEEAQVRLHKPPPDAPSPTRHFDRIIIDPLDQKAIVFEDAFGALWKGDKPMQKEKDTALLQSGGVRIKTGEEIQAKLAVRMIRYTPRLTTMKDYAARGILVYNFRTGASNLGFLPQDRRPSAAVWRAMFRPAQLSSLQQYLDNLTRTKDGKDSLQAALGLITLLGIAKDISDAYQAQTIREANAGEIALALDVMRGDYPRGRTFWARVIKISEEGGYARGEQFLCGQLPTEAPVRVEDGGPASPPWLLKTV